MVHRSEKAIRYAKELDEARLNGNSHFVPTLARKLQKHDHDKQCWAKLALCEKALIDLIATLEKDRHDSDLEDGPSRLALPPTISPEKMQDIVRDVEEAVNSPGTIEDKQLGEVIQSQMWMAMGQWKKVIDGTEQFVVGDPDIDHHGYCYVLRLKAYAYNGMAYEGLENYDAALETYLRASEFIRTSQPTISFYAVQFWISKTMYRLCMLSLRLQEPAEAIIHFRQYKRFVDAGPKPNFGFRERVVVYYWYWRLSSEIVRQGGDARTTDPQTESKELKDELWDVQNQYEYVLVEYVKFPRAGSTNQRILEFVDRAMEDWRYLGSDSIEAKELALYRATGKTFHSPRVMRHLMYAHEGSGNYVEAERSFDAYLLIVENEKKNLSRAHNSTTKPLDNENFVQDIDSDENILRTMAAGVRILVKYQNKGKKALDISEKMEQNAEAWNIENQDVLSDVWYAIGIANSLWSMQTIEPETRQAIQSFAITAYTTAISYAPTTLQTYYQLALQYAWQRNLEKSISALSHALHLDKNHVPSIHLLALVLTALEDFEKALQTCHTVKFDQVENLDIDDAIALMEMQLTYLRIVEVVSGRDLALEVQKGIFKLYYRIFGPVKPSTGYIKRETDFDQRAAMPDHTLRRTRSNIPETRNSNLKPSLGRESMESKFSFQASGNKPKRSRPFLRGKTRSHSVDGRSLGTHSSTDFSEKQPESISEANQPPVPNVVPDSTASIPNRGAGDLKSPSLVQRPSSVTSKYALSPSERREHAAKLYRAKLWLACAGIYRRGRQWDGAKAAIQDALLCEICHEDVFTELGNLCFDRSAYFDAMTNFERALLYSPDYPPATVGLARTLLSLPNDKDGASSRDRAEILLDSVTKLAGWDSSEAWFWLGEIYELCFMPVKAAECWTYCEELEERKPIREWRHVKPEWM